MRWLFQYWNFQKNKKEIINDLSQKLTVSMEKKYLELESKLKVKIFDIEKKIYSEACKDSRKTISEEKNSILNNLSNHFFY